MTKFIGGRDTVVEIRRLLEAGSPARAAVAYWGAGAVEELGISSGQDLTIVCDARSGGCNADEIRKLITTLGPERVLTHDHLHAKVWLGASAAVIGSSNASSNGLGFDGAEAASLIEANVKVDAKDVLAAVDRWWNETVWRGARKITDGDLKVGEKRRQGHRRIRPTVNDYPDLLRGLMRNPNDFAGRKLYVCVWKIGKMTKAGMAARGEAKAIYGDNMDCWEDLDPPFEEAFEEGATVIEFDSADNLPTCTGMWRVERPFGEGKLLLRREIKQFDGLELGKKAAWRAAAKRAAEEGRDDQNEWPVEEFARRFIPRAPG